MYKEKDAKMSDERNIYIYIYVCVCIYSQVESKLLVDGS